MEEEKLELVAVYPDAFPLCRSLYMKAVENSMFSHFTQDDLSFDAAFQQPNSYFRLIVLGDQIIGLAGFERIRWIDRVAQGMISLVESMQKQGLATEACKLIITEAVEKLNLRKISCAVLENGPSEKMLAKLGFQVEGLLINEKFENGEYRNGVILSWINDRDELPEV